MMRRILCRLVDAAVFPFFFFGFFEHVKNGKGYLKSPTQCLGSPHEGHHNQHGSKKSQKPIQRD